MTKTELSQLRLDIKKANQRLVEQEKRGYTTAPAYKQVMGLYDMKKNYIGKSASGSLKFATALKGLTNSELETLRHQVENYLQAKTSTTTGYKSYRENIRKAVEDTFERPMTDEEITAIYESTLFKSLASNSAIGSSGAEQLIKEYGNEDMTDEDVKYMLENNLSPDDIENFMGNYKHRFVLEEYTDHDTALEIIDNYPIATLNETKLRKLLNNSIDKDDYFNLNLLDKQLNEGFI